MPAPNHGAVAAAGIQDAISTSFTRPADTTAYAAQDVVSNSTSSPAVLTFAAAGRYPGSSGIILSARHMKSSTSTSGATYRLHLYRVAPTAIADNAPFTMLYANRANKVGFIDFLHSAAGAGSDCTNALSTFVNLPFLCEASTVNLFGILTVTGAYTPTSGEQHYIELHVVQN